MSFNFEVFDKRSGRLVKTPEVTIQSSGTMSLNAAAARLLGEDVDAIELLYDREQRVIGVRAVSADLPHAYPLRPVTQERTSFVINSRAFFQYYEIPTGTAIRRDVKAEHGVVLIDLKDPGRIATSNRNRAKLKANGTATLVREESSR